MAALIQIENLSRHYGDFCAVDNISFDLLQGEVLGFLGPNGAGKSTTLQMICGTLAASEGAVTINGANLQTDPIASKRHIGYLPETPPLYPDMRVDEYLQFCAQLHQLEPAKVAQAVENAKSQCGLEKVGARLIAHLSKGYKQRVGIAQAIIHEPIAIILDEPTSGLDPNQIQEIRSLIKGLAKHCGVLISSHILSEVQSICDRVVILHQGRLVYTGQITSDDDALLIILEKESPPDCLVELPGISHYECLDQNRFRLQLSGTHSAADIAESIIKRGGKLTELRPDRSSLEQIFSQLTLGEMSA